MTYPRVLRLLSVTLPLVLLAACEPPRQRSVEEGAGPAESPGMVASTPPAASLSPNAATPSPAAENPAPEPRAEVSPPADPSPAEPAAVSPASPAETSAPAVPAAPTAEEPGDSPRQPELYVAIEEGNLIVRGALSSRIQHERILETLARAFPGLPMTRELALDYSRIPVGWGNRVATPFLERYLNEVENPAVSYREGVVTLSGKPKPGTSVQGLTELAIETFADEMTRELVNRLLEKP